MRIRGEFILLRITSNGGFGANDIEHLASAITLFNNVTWETLASRRKIARLCALYKAYGGERAWKAIGDRLERPHYLSRADHNLKIRNRRQRTDIGNIHL